MPLVALERPPCSDVLTMVPPHDASSHPEHLGEDLSLRVDIYLDSVQRYIRMKLKLSFLHELSVGRVCSVSGET